MTTPTIPLPEPVGFVDSDGDFHGRLPQDGKTYSSDQLLEYAAARVAELQAEVSRLREALTTLWNSCDDANGRAIKQLGGVVIDFSVMEAARRVIEPGSVAFCGGWTNVLKPLLGDPPQLTWEQDDARAALEKKE